MLTVNGAARNDHIARPVEVSSPMLVVERVEKSFPATTSMSTWLRSGGRIPRRRVLHGIDFSIARGELFGLLGPNGAGKTSLLKMLASLSIPDSGRIILDGVDIVRHPREAKRRIGLCTAEERSFYFRLTGRQNLAFFGALVGLRGRTLHRRVDDVAELVDLSDALDQSFHGYSSGMRQRLTVARALLADPEVLFFDEPTRAVDPVHAEGLRRLIRDELVDRQGKTVVLATNLLNEAWALCDRIAVIDGGTVIAIGPPQSLALTLRRRLRYDIVVERVPGDMLAQLQAIPDVARAGAFPHEDGDLRFELELEPDGTALTDVLHALLSSGAHVRHLRSIEPDPMDVFKHITGGGAAS